MEKKLFDLEGEEIDNWLEDCKRSDGFVTFGLFFIEKLNVLEKEDQQIKLLELMKKHTYNHSVYTYEIMLNNLLRTFHERKRSDLVELLIKHGALY